MPVFLRSDPEIVCYGSSFTPPPRTGHKTQYILFSQRHDHLYIVLYPVPVTRPAGTENSASLIPSPCYTSGKSAIGRKSDHTGTVKR
ncbi:hypothetical protein AHX51_28215 [Salmonella enterica subsp. diarizonae]|nr:hypothetical protein [Salmonella enterica subsp. diarizonae]